MELAMDFGSVLLRKETKAAQVQAYLGACHPPCGQERMAAAVARWSELCLCLTAHSVTPRQHQALAQQGWHLQYPGIHNEAQHTQS